MRKKMNKIAYLAPEIPALSATFVYNDILQLEDMGFEVIPLSVHVPGHVAMEKSVAGLAGKTRYLYRESKMTLFGENLWMLAKRPAGYLATCLMALKDAKNVGMFSHIGKGLIYRFLVGAKVAKILMEEGCDHLHANFAHIPTDIAMYASCMSDIPFSFVSHANDLFERGWLLREKVDRSLFSVTISDYNRQFLADHGASKEKIHVIHCGVDSSSFGIFQKKIIKSPPRIGTLGRLVEKKGVDVLISACHILKQKELPFSLEIAGNGPLAVELKQRVSKLGLSSQIQFKGPVSHDLVPGWLSKLDLFVLPCKQDKKGDQDGIPVVLMEAMLTGTMVVSTKISGIPELVQNGQTGYIVEPNDPTALAEAIETAMQDDSVKMSIQKNAVAKVCADFDLNKNIKKLANLLKE